MVNIKSNKTRILSQQKHIHLEEHEGLQGNDSDVPRAEGGEAWHPLLLSSLIAKHLHYINKK